MSNKKYFVRSLDPQNFSLRTKEEGGKRYLTGYASVFNQKSKLIFERGEFFYEVIDPHAFDEVLKDPNLRVYLTLNHSRDKVMATLRAGTLQLSVDEKGLRYDAEIPDVSYANDTYTLVKRGDYFENSFKFWADAKDIVRSKDSEGNVIHLIRKVSELADVSVVTEGAYENTSLVARNAKISLSRGKTITITISEQDDDNVEPEEEPMDGMEKPMEDPSTMMEEKAVSEEKPEEKPSEDASTGTKDEPKREIYNQMNMKLRLFKLKII